MDMSSAMKIDVPKVEAPKAKAPKVEAPQVEAPKVEASKVEAPKVEALKVEAPKVEAPKIEALKFEAPKVEVPDVAAATTAQVTDTVASISAVAKSAAVAADGAMEGLEAKAEEMQTAADSAIFNMVDEVKSADASLDLDTNPFSSFMAQVSMLFETCMKKTEMCMNGTGEMAESAMEAASRGAALVSDTVGKTFDEAAKANPYAQDPEDK